MLYSILDLKKHIFYKEVNKFAMPNISQDFQGFCDYFRKNYELGFDFEPISMF